MGQSGLGAIDWGSNQPYVLASGTLVEQNVPTGSVASYAVSLPSVLSVGSGTYGVLLVDSYQTETAWRWQYEKRDDNTTDVIGQGQAYVSGYLSGPTKAESFEPLAGGSYADLALVVYGLPDTAGIEVPEPASWSLLALALAGLGSVYVRRR